MYQIVSSNNIIYLFLQSSYHILEKPGVYISSIVDLKSPNLYDFTIWKVYNLAVLYVHNKEAT